MVAAAKFLADLLEREVREVAHEVHGDLAGHGGLFAAALPAQVGAGELERARGLFNDDVRRGDIGAGADDVPDGALDGIDRDRIVENVAVSGQALDDTLELTDVRGDVFRNVLDDVLGEDHAELRGLRADDGRARLEIRRLNVREQTALEPGAQPVVEALHLLRRPVGGHDDLLAGLIQAVEGVEKFLLRAVLARDELDIVHEQQIRVAVFLAEVFGRAGADGFDHLIDELLALDVGNLRRRIVVADGLADGEQKVRLAEAGVAVDQQGVIRLAGILRHGDGRCVGKLVARTDDEAVKRVAVHLRHFLGRRALLAVFEQLIIPGEHDQLERAGKQIVQHGADRLFKARLNDAALKIRRGVHDERIIIDLNGGAIGKPGIDRRLGQLLREAVHDDGPDIGERIHGGHRFGSFDDFSLRGCAGISPTSIAKIHDYFNNNVRIYYINRCRIYRAEDLLFLCRLWYDKKT